MSEAAARNAAIWDDALLACDLLAVDPACLGGVVLRAGAGTVREAWLTRLKAELPAGAPLLRAPCDAGDAELLGGLDLSATLAAGHTVAQRGLLARSHGGLLLLPMAERLARTPAAHIAAALDSGEVVAERDGLTIRSDARLAAIALDEGLADDDRPPAALLDRLAFHVDLRELSHRDVAGESAAPDTSAARLRLPDVAVPDHLVEALCAACAALGVGSARAPLLALKAARASAALAGRLSVADEDAALAARLVIAPRAQHLPAEQPDEEQEQAAQEPPEQPPESPDDDTGDVKTLDDTVLDAALAALPPGLLAQLQANAQRLRAGQTGKAGEAQNTVKRGRPIGARRGDPRSGVRLDLLHTLRAAAPWQRLRKQSLAGANSLAGGPARPTIEIRRDDFRIKRFRDRKQTTTIFLVDASGSAALERLGEAKGAVELLLADCYIRRDEVALIAFRGIGADVLLPPTRSLHRARKELAALPGGGGTPLAAGIMAAGLMADEVRRKGRTPTLVLITDGRANVTREGIGGRAQAQDEAGIAARSIKAQGLRTLLVDNSNRPEPRAGQLAADMGALYLPLPRASSQMISNAVRASAPAAQPVRR
jgi:magnesium chelatase subunit D